MKHLLLIVTLFLSVTLTGCGSGAKVGGTVKYEDGSPVAFGTVVFETEKEIFRGQIKPDGSYQLGVNYDGQKIPFGTYKVYFSSTDRIEPVYNSAGEATDDNISFPQMTAEFTSSSTSPLQATVSAKKQFDFAVKRHPDWDKQQKYGKK